MTEITTSIDGVDEKFQKQAGIATFYLGRDYMHETDRALAIAEGRMKADDPDYREVVFCRIKYPGNPYTAPDRPAVLERRSVDEPSDIEKWPAAYSAFVNSSKPVEGTPIAALRGMRDGDIAHLESLHLRSIEQLESLSDSHVINLGMGMRRYRDMARDWRAQQPRKVVDAAAEAEMAELRTQIAELRASLKPARGRKQHEMEAADVELVS